MSPPVFPLYLGRCLDVVTSLLELATGHPSALVTSLPEGSGRGQSEPVKQVSLFGIQLQERCRVHHPDEGPTKVIFWVVWIA